MSKKSIVQYFQEKYESDYLYFDDFMEESLYSNFGFFNTEKIRSNKEGDFLTSPEISNFFGKFISNWILRNNLTKNIIEIGSGSGKLINQINLENIVAIEKSSTAMFELNKQGIRTFKDLNSLPFTESDLVFGNEVLDNIPCSIGIFKNGEWNEKVVKIFNNEFSYDIKPIRQNELNWINSNKIQPNKNQQVEIQRNIDSFLLNLHAKLNPKKILFIDYGYIQEERHLRKYDSLLRTYKNHHLSVDPIESPGQVDITYDVNFSAVERYLISLDYKVEIIPQKEFLYQNGFDEVYSKLYSQYISSDGIEQLKINNLLTGLMALVDSNGLGGFYCLLAEKYN